MTPACFACPLSGEEVCDPCPVHRCPANLTAFGAECSCAYQLEDLSHLSLSRATHLDASEIKRLTQSQTVDLATTLREFKQLLDFPVTNPCSNCGYIEPCESRSLCEERRVVASEILVNINREGAISLKMSHLWVAVLNEMAGFLLPQQRESLLELVSSKHVRRT